MTSVPPARLTVVETKRCDLPKSPLLPFSWLSCPHCGIAGVAYADKKKKKRNLVHLIRQPVMQMVKQIDDNESTAAQ